MSGQCPRCRAEKITLLARSAAPGLWEVLSCPRCTYSWRTTEPAVRTSADAYPTRFALTEDDITNAPEVPPVAGALS